MVSQVCEEQKKKNKVFIVEFLRAALWSDIEPKVLWLRGPSLKGALYCLVQAKGPL